jgi:hypothetical protein
MALLRWSTYPLMAPSSSKWFRPKAWSPPQFFSVSIHIRNFCWPFLSIYLNSATSVLPWLVPSLSLSSHLDGYNHFLTWLVFPTCVPYNLFTIKAGGVLSKCKSNHIHGCFVWNLKGPERCYLFQFIFFHILLPYSALFPSRASALFLQPLTALSAS